MLKIKLNDYDRLNNFVEEICILAYLLDLSHSYDKNIVYDNKLDATKNLTISYLITKQCETVSKLLDLMDENNFAVSDKRSFSDKAEKLP